MTLASFRECSDYKGHCLCASSAAKPHCDTTDHCALARSCKAGHCGACETDGDCLVNEACVLQRVEAENVGCRKRSDCDGQRCILPGYSSGPRGNEEMRSFCNSSEGGNNTQTKSPDDHAHQDYGATMPSRVKIDSMREELGIN